MKRRDFYLFAALSLLLTASNCVKRWPMLRDDWRKFAAHAYYPMWNARPSKGEGK